MFFKLAAQTIILQLVLHLSLVSMLPSPSQPLSDIEPTPETYDYEAAAVTTEVFSTTEIPVTPYIEASNKSANAKQHREERDLSNCSRGIQPMEIHFNSQLGLRASCPFIEKLNTKHDRFPESILEVVCIGCGNCKGPHRSCKQIYARMSVYDKIEHKETTEHFRYGCVCMTGGSNPVAGNELRF